MKNNEQELVERLVGDLYESRKVWLEVPNMGQSVDVVVNEGGDLLFIEVKVQNWARAFKQCRAHELVADFIYVAIATKNLSDNLIAEAKSRGYGIIHFNWNCNRWEYVIKSERNKNLWFPQREILNSKLNINSYAAY